MGNLRNKGQKGLEIDEEMTPLIGEITSITNDAKLSQYYNSCIMCLASFGIQEDRIPYECVERKCGRLYCRECVTMVQHQQGKARKFRCMFCLHEYPKNEAPIPCQKLKNQLWTAAKIKHGISYTRYLLGRLSSPSLKYDLLCDIDCRLKHLTNLISTLERYTRLTQNISVKDEAHIMSDKLTVLLQQVEKDSTNIFTKYQQEYRQIISNSDEEDELGVSYIRVCEELLLDISNAEFHRAFSNTHAKMIEWSAKLASTVNFQPQVQDLVGVIEKDLRENWFNHRYGIIRSKIGIIGYTSVGKSTLVNRILGISDLQSVGSSPVRSIKSTYYPLQFDRKEVLISPDDPSETSHVTLVDIQGLDKDTAIVGKKLKPGNYLDEIRKADCDIYILVFDEQLRYEQIQWIEFIEKILKRKCVLVRSKIDIDFLAKFRERTGVCFGLSTAESQEKFVGQVLENLKIDNYIESHHVYLVAADFMPSNSDANLLLKNQSFDMNILIEDLSRLAFQTRKNRIHGLAIRAVARVVNICFRRAYVLKVLNYKIGAGFAAIVPFGDQIPRYLARDNIRKSFGVNKQFQNFLMQYHLIIDEQNLQTTTLEKCVTATTMSKKASKASLGAAVGGAFIATAPFSDDILRAAAPTMIVLTGAARVALTATTAVVGVIISSAVCAWSAVDAGKHIFSYVNRLSDDLILVCNPLIQFFVESLSYRNQYNYVNP